MQIQNIPYFYHLKSTSFNNMIMNRLLIFLLAVTISLSGFAQDTVNRKDESGRKQGYWTKKDTAGNKIYEGHFRNNIPSGTFTYYYPGGKIKAVSVFSNDGKTTKTITYFPGGKKNAEGTYLLEKREGLWQFYSEFDGALVSEEFYKEGKKEGVAKTFFPGKGVLELITWKNDIREGLWEQYFDDGALKLRCSYKNDLKEGPITVYFPTGQKFNTGQYQKGFSDGTWLTYDLDGKIIVTDVYDRGILVKTTEQPEPPLKEIKVKED
jgi:antitoxin component YwqK of YwqJK toxin-antitoxin module